MSSGTKDIYFPELDTLRFFAFLLVFIHHAPIFSTISILRILHNYGWMGVDLFLCLSAFLFTKLLSVEYRTTGDINIRKFYIRRLLRVWPLYYVFFGVIFIWTIGSQGLDRSVLQRSLGMLSFTDNIFAAFLSYNTFWGSAHLWTISYEEQFYAIIPWILRKLYKTSLRTIIIGVSIVFGIGTLVKAIFIYSLAPHPAIWVLPITHFESILGGLIIGLGLFDRYLGRIPVILLALLGAGSFVVVCNLPNVDEMGWSLLLLYPLIGLGTSLILYSTMVWKPSRLKAGFQSRIPTYLGKISYGLYVYHILGIDYAGRFARTLDFSPDRLLAYPLIIFGTGLGITILASILSYQLLEKPFLRIKDRFALVHSRPL